MLREQSTKQRGTGNQKKFTFKGSTVAATKMSADRIDRQLRF